MPKKNRNGQTNSNTKRKLLVTWIGKGIKLKMKEKKGERKVKEQKKVVKKARSSFQNRIRSRKHKPTSQPSSQPSSQSLIHTNKIEEIKRERKRKLERGE